MKEGTHKDEDQAFSDKDKDDTKSRTWPATLQVAT